ncbi:MAG TPA: amidohydrolase family protein [Candidatus Udaeobacter sp.]|jgi:cytosine/adenosine deaminase-related metal-dependent hydrolase
MPESGERRMIIRARTVVTMDGAPIENGAVAVSENRIVDVAKFDEIRARNAGEIVDLGEQALVPGLINAHCHLDYTCLRGKIPPQKSFADWIRSINAEKAKLLPKDYLVSINEGFAEAKRFGTTTIADLTAFPDLIPETGPPIRTWWFAELIDVRAPDRTNEIVDLAIESLKSARNWGLAPHALFTASKNLYRRCEDIARPNDVLLTTHLAESQEEMEMFHDASGPLYEFLKNIGRPMNDCGKGTPLELFLGALPSTSLRTGSGRGLPQCIVAHLNEVTESDFDLLQRSERRFHVVHSPRSHDYFKHSRFPFEKLHALGFNICLGTDSLASNESLSLFDEMRAFRRSEPGISPNKILEMVTVNPATALHQENALGRIRRGLRADLIAVRCNERDSPFEQILEFDGSVDWIMVNGKL